MKIHKTFIEDCVWIEPHKFDDNRGIFRNLQILFLPHLNPCNHYSFSKEGVLRGITGLICEIGNMRQGNARCLCRFKTRKPNI